MSGQVVRNRILSNMQIFSCNTENYVLMVVPGFSSGSSITSAAQPSTTSSSQESKREESAQILVN